MSAIGTKRTFGERQSTSAFGGKADIDEREIDKLIEATKRATSFRGFSFAKSHETANRRPKEKVKIADLAFVAFVVIITVIAVMLTLIQIYLQNPR